MHWLIWRSYAQNFLMELRLSSTAVVEEIRMFTQSINIWTFKGLVPVRKYMDSLEKFWGNWLSFISSSRISLCCLNWSSVFWLQIAIQCTKIAHHSLVEPFSSKSLYAAACMPRILLSYFYLLQLHRSRGGKIPHNFLDILKKKSNKILFKSLLKI